LPTNKPRYTITVSDDLLRNIDDFRFGNRYASRSAATLELIRLGIEEIRKNQEVPAKSGDSENS
jgi:metal-responsive CopG/Arc/MetJ family transcriptional regulator